MGSDDFNYLNPEDRRRSNESDLFARVAFELENRTDLSGLEARGTLAIALKIAGYMSRDVGAPELLATVRTVLAGELRVRGVKGETEVCSDVVAMLEAVSSSTAATHRG